MRLYLKRKNEKIFFNYQKNVCHAKHNKCIFGISMQSNTAVQQGPLGAFYVVERVAHGVLSCVSTIKAMKSIMLYNQTATITVANYTCVTIIIYTVI